MRLTFALTSILVLAAAAGCMEPEGAPDPPTEPSPSPPYGIDDTNQTGDPFPGNGDTGNVRHVTDPFGQR